MKNYLKMYEDYIEKVPEYRNDLTYFLFKIFVRDFLELVIVDAIRKRKTKTFIYIDQIKEYYKIRNFDVSELDMLDILKYLNNFPGYIQGNHIVCEDVKALIRYFYVMIRDDEDLIMANLEGIKINYEEIVVKKILPLIIKSAESNNRETIEVVFKLKKDRNGKEYTTFFGVPLRRINGVELWEFVKNIPGEIIPVGDGEYKIIYNVIELNCFYNEELKRMQKEMIARNNKRKHEALERAKWYK